MTAKRRGTVLASKEFRAADGTRLMLRQIVPDLLPRGRVLFVHGLGEHSGRHLHIARALAAAGFHCDLPDLRGHGNSGGPRGDARSLGVLVKDLAMIARQGAMPGLPFFVHGHSFGAHLALRACQKGALVPDGLTLTAPWIGLAFDPPAWKLALGQIARRLYPAFALSTGISKAGLSRDAEFLAALPDPHLLHRRITARLFFGVRESAKSLMRWAPQMKARMLMIHGEADPVTSPAASRAFFDAAGSGDKTYLAIAGARHEVHNDACREEVIAAIVAWCSARA